jgi:hypothetical protein
MTGHDPETIRSRSRRALLGGVLGGLGAWVASAVGRTSPVLAEGEAVVVGGEYTTATSVTRLQNSSNSATVFMAQSAGAGVGVWGESAAYYAVNGVSGSGAGLRGISSSNHAVVAYSDATQKASVLAESGGHSTGLLGYSGSATPVALDRTGVYGVADQDATSRGVSGYSPSGIGLYGSSDTGFALRTSGRLKADRASGVATIRAGRTSVSVNPGLDITSSSFVLITPKANVGSRALWFTTDTTGNTFSIRMSSSRSSNTRVAWLLVG